MDTRRNTCRTETYKFTMKVRPIEAVQVEQLVQAHMAIYIDGYGSSIAVGAPDQGPRDIEVDTLL